MPIKSIPSTVDTKEQEPPTAGTGRETRRATEKEYNATTSTTTSRKPAPTDKYDDEAMLAKFNEEEDVVREDHVTQTQYLSDLAVNTDNEITSLHVSKKDTFSFFI